VGVKGLNSRISLDGVVLEVNYTVKSRRVELKESLESVRFKFNVVGANIR